MSFQIRARLILTYGVIEPERHDLVILLCSKLLP
jgi:hypothetical protein